MNLMVGFRSAFQVPAGARAVLRIAGSTAYRISLNGRFVGYGPARGPHGFYRVDEWPLFESGDCMLAIEVAGYNVNSFYWLDAPSFLQAEVVVGDRVLASTVRAGAGFEAFVLLQRVQKVARFSFQRTFGEVYRLAEGFDRWRTDKDAALPAVDCDFGLDKRLLPRRVPYPALAVRLPVVDVAAGGLEHRPIDKPRRNRFLEITDRFKGYPTSQQEFTPWLDLQHYTTHLESINRPLEGGAEFNLDSLDARILAFGANLTGFIGCTIRCDRPTRLIVSFDEVLTGGDVDFLRLNCHNLVEYNLAAGRYEVETFEPCTLRFLKFQVIQGACRVEDAYLRLYDNPEADRGQFVAGDPELNELFEAGRETFRQNATDTFMDCPSRERAGWLCDSFFSARAGLDLCGTTSIERAFFENYLLPEKFSHLPEGMLPMCYPADHNDEKFIPQWALWFVLQLEEYVTRGGDRDLVNAMRPRVLKLMEWFGGYHNSDGLLEQLPSWNFIEWSKANSFVQDVHYPTNMLYAGALDAASRLYGPPPLAERARAVRAEVLRQSYDGEFFIDNAVRTEEGLERTVNRSEVCQYFAFFFGLASPPSHPSLWQALVSHFGPQRRDTSAYPEIHHANTFIGNVLRLEVLSRFGRQEQAIRELKGYFLKMARTTGTLWENDSTVASCNHGFASHVCHVLTRDALGIVHVDVTAMNVQVRLSDVPLSWCRGKIPLGEGSIDMEWWRQPDGLHYRLTVPASYTVSLAPDSVPGIRHA